jgi:hypothetical protein
MKSLVGLVMLVGSCFVVACQPVRISASSAPSSPANVAQTDQAATSLPIPTQSTAPASSAAGSAPTMAAPVTWESGGPLFIAVVQTTIMAGESMDRPSVDVGPVSFAYDLDNRILMLHPTISPASLKADVVIGLVTQLETPTAIYTRRELMQLPAKPRFMQNLEADSTTGSLSFVYDGQSYSLLPGKSVSFDKVKAATTSATTSILITNHGRLAGARSMPIDSAVP